MVFEILVGVWIAFGIACWAFDKFYYEPKLTKLGYIQDFPIKFIDLPLYIFCGIACLYFYWESLLRLKELGKK